MTCSSIGCNPYFWTMLTGAMIGLSISCAFRARIPALKRWTAAVFLFTLAIVIALTGAFASGAKNLLDVGLVYMLFGSALLFALVSRFPRAAGLPLLTALLVTTILLLIELGRWDVVDADQPYLLFSVHSRTPGAMTIGIVREGDQADGPAVGTISGDSITFEIETLHAVPVWFFAARYARLLVPEVHAHRSMSTFLSRIPGWESRVVTSDPFLPKSFYRYRLFVEPDSGIRFELVLPGE